MATIGESLRDDGVDTTLRLAEQASNPATPASGYGRLYAKADGLYFIDDAGTVTGPFGAGGGSSAFVGARAYLSVDQAAATGTVVPLNLAAETFDTSTIHDTATNNTRFTIPSGKAGKWRFGGQIYYPANATGNRSALLRKNGATVTTNYTGPTAGASNAVMVAVTDVLDLIVGDYIELIAYHTAGVSLNVTNGSHVTFLVAEYLGT